MSAAPREVLRYIYQLGDKHQIVLGNRFTSDCRAYGFVLWQQIRQRIYKRLMVKLQSGFSKTIAMIKLVDMSWFMPV